MEEGEVVLKVEIKDEIKVDIKEHRYQWMEKEWVKISSVIQIVKGRQIRRANE